MEERLSLEKWSDLWRRLGARADPRPGHTAVLAAYAEAHRHYHTGEHIARTLALLDGVRGRLRRPVEAELATWLHDVVYDPHAVDNEARSADFAARLLAGGGAAADAATVVRALIMATRHDAPPDDPDARYVVDADLSILGAPPAEFDRYEIQVRREYAFVAEADWRARRPRILHRFLDRARIYETAEFAHLEAPARDNLARALRRIGAPPVSPMRDAPP